VTTLLWARIVLLVALSGATAIVVWAARKERP